MVITKTKEYMRDYKRKIINKNKIAEENRIAKIERYLLSCSTLHDVLIGPYKNIYDIKQKHGNLKEFYTADVNSKLRLVMKPLGEYPYNAIEIMGMEFLEIDDSHYGEG